jgi:hypothetical protein
VGTRRPEARSIRLDCARTHEDEGPLPGYFNCSQSGKAQVTFSAPQPDTCSILLSLAADVPAGWRITEGGIVMTETQRIEPDPLQTQRSPCARCGARMSLTRIEPETPGVDRRTFECAQCQHIEIVLVAFTRPPSVGDRRRSMNKR